MDIRYKDIKVEVSLGKTNENSDSFFQTIKNYLDVKNEYNTQIKRFNYGVLFSVLTSFFLFIYIIDNRSQIDGSLILCILFIIIAIISTVLCLRSIKKIKEESLLTNMKIEYSSITYWEEIVKLLNMHGVQKENSVIGLNLNVSALRLDSEIYLLPNVCIKKSSSGIRLFKSNEILSNIKYTYKTMKKSESSRHKHRDFYYRTWLHPRRDGGPDRRFNTNYEIDYYKVPFMEIFSASLNIRHSDRLKKLFEDQYRNILLSKSKGILRFREISNNDPVFMSGQLKQKKDKETLEKRQTDTAKVIVRTDEILGKIKSKIIVLNNKQYIRIYNDEYIVMLDKSIILKNNNKITIEELLRELEEYTNVYEGNY